MPNLLNNLIDTLCSDLMKYVRSRGTILQTVPRRRGDGAVHQKTTINSVNMYTTGYSDEQYIIHKNIYVRTTHSNVELTLLRINNALNTVEELRKLRSSETPEKISIASKSHR